MVIAAIRDISEKVEIQKQLEKLRDEELERVQDRLIQSEKMVSLGNLMAGIAHEINTPLGAIKASIEGILDNDSFLQELIFLVNTLSEKEMHLFLNMVEDSGRSTLVLSTKEERLARKQFQAYLVSLGWSDVEHLADIMVDMHLMGVEEMYKPLLLHEKSKKIFNIAHQITGLRRNGKTIKLAVDKAAKIIYALKSYSHFDTKDKFVEFDLVEGINNILTLYSNQIKQGIELVKDFDDISPISCFPDQLGQVWTNLIANAIHAMEGEGILTISVKQQKEIIKIKIIDTGKGIPEDIQDLIFTPFFTTKSSGEGSGLGLDLVRKIVHKHGGNISFESIPGKTVFTVEIPKKKYINQYVKLKLAEIKKENK